MTRVCAVLAILVSVAACGGGASMRSGITDCGDFDKCQAGQYCEDPRFGMCTNGCISDRIAMAHGRAFPTEMRC
jgi:hypothetical protein